VRLQAYEVTENGKPQMLYDLLVNESGCCLVFCRTRRGTERIAKGLNRQGINAAMIHGDRSQSPRIAALTGF
jgi:ATP-dependent RNA helicase RhlE